SPAADTIPPLFVYEAIATVAGPKGLHEVPIHKFFVAPGRTVLERGEFLLRLRLPPVPPRSGAHYLRFIPRNEMDIAVVGAGAALPLDESRPRCVHARVALAAVAPPPLLVPEAGAALVDGPLTDALIEKAASLAQTAAKPISDMRGTAAYR